MTDAPIAVEHLNEVMDTLVREGISEPAARKAIHSAARGSTKSGTDIAMHNIRGMQGPEPVAAGKAIRAKAATT